MSYFSFLIKPHEYGVTSCMDQSKIEDEITPAILDDYVTKLSLCNTIAINQQAAKGKILINGFSNTLNDFKKTYFVNDNWEIIPIRANLRTWFFILHPTHITARSSFITGVKKIGKTHIGNSFDLTQWLKFNRLNKLFYLKEFGEILNSVSQTKALLSYSEHFTPEELNSWVEHYGWEYPTMSYTHRLYLKRHVRQHITNLKRISQGK